jgi:hypothetical protein
MLDFIGDDIESAKTCIKEICKQRKDSRAALKAATMIIDHQRDLYKHENPTTQKSEVTHLTPIPMNLTVTIAKDK